MPRYSILLPTHNRLEYLKLAVETVLRQTEQDWEIVISDNVSGEDIEGYCKGLGDPRILYSRTEAFLPVTENWNRAIDRAAGDYVLMLGDDDGLMPGYLERVGRLIGEFSEPELLHTNAYLIAYPGAVPDHPGGYLAQWTYDLFRRSEPYLLDRETALQVVKETFRFSVGFGWNMQFSLVKRSLIDEMKKLGPFYQSNYPDYYASNAMFLKAGSILVCPEPMIAIGITPKSFGSFYFSGDEQKGVDMLNHALLEESLGLHDVVLPGEDHNTSWLTSVETLKRNLPVECRDIEVSYARYRLLQIVHLYRQAYLDPSEESSREQLGELQRRMAPRERLLGFGLAAFFAMLRRMSPARRERWLLDLHARLDQYPPHTLRMLDLEEPVRDMLDLVDRKASGRIPD